MEMEIHSLNQMEIQKVESIANSLIYCKLVPSVCIIHMMMLLVSQIFNVLTS